MRTLSGWLEFIERQHPKTIALGLERVAVVLERMALRPAYPVITVGGTNGKGSTCAMLEAILHAAGYRCALYTSPHLLRYNERVRIGGKEAGDDALCALEEREGLGEVAAHRRIMRRVECRGQTASASVAMGGRRRFSTRRRKDSHG